ncbi:MAG: hypothetical protein XXXJIFNMEKO3_01771 [Candidatus Erwinia impunctatus]
MRFLCLDIPRSDATQEDYLPYLTEESRYGWKLYKDELIREIYLRRDRLGVVVAAESESAEACRNALNQLPLVKAGVISWEIIPIGLVVVN